MALEADVFIPGQCTGIPSAEEIRWWEEHDSIYNKFAICPVCPDCGSGSTRWVRQNWCICFRCHKAFDTMRSLSYEEWLEDEYYPQQDDMKYFAQEQGYK